MASFGRENSAFLLSCLKSTSCKAEEIKAVGIAAERDKQPHRTKWRSSASLVKRGIRGIRVGANSRLVLNPPGELPEQVLSGGRAHLFPSSLFTTSHPELG